MTATTSNTGSPHAYARWAGVLALVLVFVGPFSMMYVPTTLVVPGDASATAERLVEAESLFRLGILGDTVIVLTEVVLIGLLYTLFKPVNATLSLTAAMARLAMTVVQGVNIMNSLVVLLLLSGAGYLGAFDQGQLHALALLFLNAHEQVAHIWEIFFALHCLLLGVLIFRSGFVPKILGPLMGMAAAGYLANGIGNLLYPEARSVLAPLVAVTAIFGELPFFLWLLAKGVSVEAWRRFVWKAQTLAVEP
ncbi:MAG: DUF4386 domain-containing protein [Pseudomonadota bacterium]|nr:DUF4386 domain-containing protein [Pseudomonadota bacterium]